MPRIETYCCPRCDNRVTLRDMWRGLCAACFFAPRGLRGPLR
jgi:hypothetical protein